MPSFAEFTEQVKKRQKNNVAGEKNEEADFDKWLKAQASELQRMHIEYIDNAAMARFSGVSDEEIEAQGEKVLGLERDIIEKCLETPNRLEHLCIGLGVGAGSALLRLSREHPDEVFTEEMFDEVRDIMSKHAIFKAGEDASEHEKRIFRAAASEMESVLIGQEMISDKVEYIPSASLAGFESFFDIVESSEFGEDFKVKPATVELYLQKIVAESPDDSYRALAEKVQGSYTKDRPLIKILESCVQDFDDLDSVQQNWRMFQRIGAKEESLGGYLEQFAQSCVRDFVSEAVFWLSKLYVAHPEILQSCVDQTMSMGDIKSVDEMSGELRGVGVKLDEATLRAYRIESGRRRVPGLENVDFDWGKLPAEIREESENAISEAKERLRSTLTAGLLNNFNNTNWRRMTDDEQVAQIERLKVEVEQAYGITMPCELKFVMMHPSTGGACGILWYKESENGVDTDAEVTVKPGLGVWLNLNGMDDGEDVAKTVAHELFHGLQLQKGFESIHNDQYRNRGRYSLAEYYRANDAVYKKGYESQASYDAYRSQLVEHEAWEMGDFMLELMKK